MGEITVVARENRRRPEAGAAHRRRPAAETMVEHDPAAPLSDVTVARARRGDIVALEAVFRTVEGPVFGLAHRLCGHWQDAEDVLQETFMEIVRSLPRFRGDCPLPAWVKRVAASKALMRLRTHSRRREDLVEDGEVPGVSAPGHDHVGHRVDLEGALGTLTPTARAVVWLHDVEGYTHEEIAGMAGRSVSFSKSQLARAHARLRECLAPWKEE